MVTMNHWKLPSPQHVSNCESIKAHTMLQYLTAKACLYNFFKSSCPGRILLPNFLPRSVLLPFERLGWKLHFYSVPLSLNLDKKLITHIIKRHAITHFYYIHHFGIFNQNNQDLINDLSLNDIKVIDDRSHTLPPSPSSVSALYTLYSFSKILACPPAAILFTNEAFKSSQQQGSATSLVDRLLSYTITMKRALLSQCPSALSYRLASRILRGIDASLDQQFHSHFIHHGPSGKNIVQQLSNTNWAAINDARRGQARLYLEFLPPDLLLPLHHEAYTTQSLQSFPLKVKNQKAFHRAMLKNGIFGWYLDGGWSDTGNTGERLGKHHYMLPMNPKFNRRKIMQICMSAIKEASYLCK